MALSARALNAGKAVIQLSLLKGPIEQQLKTLQTRVAGVSGDLQQFTDKMHEIIKGAIDWTKTHRELIAVFAKAAVGLTALSVTTYAFGTAMKVAAGAVGILRVAVTMLSAHPMIALATAIGAIVVAVAHFSGALDGVYGWLGKVGSGAENAAGRVDRMTEAMKNAAAATKGLSIEEQIAAKHKQMMEAAGMPKTLAKLRIEMEALQASKRAFDAGPKDADARANADNPFAFIELEDAATKAAEKAKAAWEKAKAAAIELERKFGDALLGPQRVAEFKLMQAADAGKAAAFQTMRQPEAMFDTRLAQQMIGATDSIQREQLTTQKKMLNALQNRRGGLPVI